MLGMMFAFTGGVSTAVSNLILRYSSERNSDWILAVGYFVAMCLSLLISAFSGTLHFNYPIILLGIFIGVSTAALMSMLSRALSLGANAVTISIVSASSLIPGVIAYFVYGSGLGFDYNITHFIGSLIVLFGFLNTKTTLPKEELWKKWLFWVFSLFWVHVAILLAYQWQGYLVSSESNYLRFMTRKEALSGFFMPSIFFVAFVCQVCKAYRNLLSNPFKAKNDLLVGACLGAFQICTVLALVFANQYALSWEKAIIFPAFSVMIIIATGVWRSWLYKEEVAWAGIGLCALGISVATAEFTALSQAYSFVRDSAIAFFIQ